MCRVGPALYERPCVCIVCTVMTKSLETPCRKWFLISDQLHLEFRFWAIIRALINIFVPDLVP